MSSIPPLVRTSAFRTSTSSQFNIQQSNIRKALNRVLELETQLATGFRVNVPSDDPLAATRALFFRRQIEQGEQYQRNISIAQAELSTTDDALASLSDIVIRAKEIYLAAQDSTTAGYRANAATEVDLLIREAASIVNRKFHGRYLFGGRDGSEAPFQVVGSFVNFVGSEEAAEVTIALGESIGRNMTAPESFGGLSAEIVGRVDLNPTLSLGTKLADLNGGRGVRLGSIQIADGLGLQRTIDLSAAETVGDVINAINADGIATASINAAENGIDLAVAGGNITVSEVNNGFTAFDLGILQSLAGPTLNGTDIDPAVTIQTPLTALGGGVGIDLSGITITNGGTSEAISFASAQTVEDILNAVNLANIHVKATINDAGTGIDLRSSLSGAEFTLTENGGTTAEDLGLLLDFADLDVESLNSGLGVGTVEGADFQVTLKDGSTVSVDVSNAETVQDVLDLINNDSENPGTLVASIPAGQTSIQLVDSTGGTGDLSVTPINGSLAAQTLGIFQTVADPGTALTGTDLKPAAHRVDSLFDVLVQLRTSLSNVDDPHLDLVGGRLDRVGTRLIDARAEIGVRINRLEFTSTRLEDQKLRFQELIAQDREVNLAETAVEFEKHRALLEASYAVSAQSLSLSLLDFIA